MQHAYDQGIALTVLYMALALVVAMVASGCTAVLLERVAYRPLRRRGAPPLVFLITAIGASLFLQNTARGFFGAQTRGYPTPQILGGNNELLMPQLIMMQIGRRGDFPSASALSIILMAVVTLAYLACARWLKLERA